MERFTAEQEKMLPDKRTLVIKHFPKYVTMFVMGVHSLMTFFRFLSLLEQEIYNSHSPIWREDYNQTPEALAIIPSPAGSSITPTSSPAAGPASDLSRMGKL